MFASAICHLPHLTIPSELILQRMAALSAPSGRTRPQLMRPEQARALLQEEAQRRTKQFVATLHHLIVCEGLEADLIVAPGNSGAMMAGITALTYEAIGESVPRLLRIPLYLRDRESGKRIEFDNSVLLPDVCEQVSDIGRIRTILHVDDETHEEDPRTLKCALDLIASALPAGARGPEAMVHVVAELHQPVPVSRALRAHKGWQVRFHPHARETTEWPGVQNFVSKGMPCELRKPFLDLYPDDLWNKEVFCILLGEPIRAFRDGGRPVLSHAWEARLREELKGFDALQEAFRAHLRTLIGEAIGEAT